MTPTTKLHQPSRKFPAFRPENFYEAPQYASYRPSTPASTPFPPQPVITETIAPAKSKGRGRPATIQLNSLKRYLGSYNSPGHALAKLPLLDSIVTGAVNLDFGCNTRPLSKKTVLILLRRLDVISAASVEEYMLLSLRQCTVRHAQRLALCLRIIERAAAKVAQTAWPNPSQLDETGEYTPVQGIVPCGSIDCLICSGTATATDGWDLASSDGEEDHANVIAITDSSSETFGTDDWLGVGDD